jgi:hypothetical protein
MRPALSAECRGPGHRDCAGGSVAPITEAAEDVPLPVLSADDQTSDTTTRYDPAS